MTILAHRFNGKKYRIDFDKISGLHIPQGCEASLFFPKGIKNTLDSLIDLMDEMEHIYQPDLGEKRIEQIATEKAKFLWRIGFRLK